MKTCGRVRDGCEYGHKCTRTCHEDCGICPDKVPKIIPKCGHIQMVKCGLDPEKFFLKFFLKFALAYVNEPGGIQKHIMRYPQFFATKAIEEKLDEVNMYIILQ